MRRRALLLALSLGCTPPSPSPTPSPTPTPTPTPSPPPATAIDVRVEFETGLDPDYGDSTRSVRGFLVVQALGVRKKLFAVPFPWRCERVATDASADLAVRCTGDDDWGGARVHVEAHRIVVEPHDYGHTAREDVTFELKLPPGAVATLFAPTTFPSSASR
jgi:hypothetical protein